MPKKTNTPKPTHKLAINEVTSIDCWFVGKHPWIPGKCFVVFRNWPHLSDMVSESCLTPIEYKKPGRKPKKPVEKASIMHF